MYQVNTRTSEYNSENAKKAASIAASWKKHRQDVSLFVVEESKYGNLRIEEVEIADVASTIRTLISAKKRIRSGI